MNKLETKLCICVSMNTVNKSLLITEIRYIVLEESNEKEPLYLHIYMLFFLFKSKLWQYAWFYGKQESL